MIYDPEAPECDRCADTGIEPSGISFDCGDGEGEDRPCTVCEERRQERENDHGTFLLSLYEIDRAYGGCEEGGWWYDTGELRTTLRIFKSKRKAYAAAMRCNAWLHRLQKNRLAVGSIIYSGGRFSAQVHRDHAPRGYPTVTPHYE